MAQARLGANFSFGRAPPPAHTCMATTLVHLALRQLGSRQISEGTSTGQCS